MTTNNACPVTVEPQDETQLKIDADTVKKEELAKLKNAQTLSAARQTILDRLGITNDELLTILS